MNQNNHTPSPVFCNSLAFEYMETYSLQRGEAYEKTMEIWKVEYDVLVDCIKKGKGLKMAEGKRLRKLEELFHSTQYLVDACGEFHFSHVKTNTFHHSALEAKLLKRILLAPVREVVRTLCAPFYRDAAVFYNEKSEIISILNICLSCYYMETRPGQYIDADFETYDHLKNFFIDIGHQVENPDIFLMDVVNKKGRPPETHS